MKNFGKLHDRTFCELLERRLFIMNPEEFSLEFIGECLE